MKADFDKAAQVYDKQFTETTIGRLQRQRVWNYLTQLQAKCFAKNVLELNCGTGEDAQFLSALGCQVVATDSSESMLKIAKEKSVGKHSDISFIHLDLSKPSLTLSKNFDLVVSNFGGLNCINIDQLQQLASWLGRHLSDNAQVILVIMPSKTLIDRWYRVAKGQQNISKIRAEKKTLEVNVYGQLVTTYYFDPNEVIDAFKDYELIHIQSIGFAPSFLNNSRLLSPLLLLDKLLYRFNFRPDQSDHYLIHLQKNR